MKEENVKRSIDEEVKNIGDRLIERIRKYVKWVLSHRGVVGRVKVEM